MFSQNRHLLDLLLTSVTEAVQVRSLKNKPVTDNDKGRALFGTGENPFSFLKNTGNTHQLQKLVDAYCAHTNTELELQSDNTTYQISLFFDKKYVVLSAKDISAEHAVYYSLRKQLNFVSDILSNFAEPLYLTDKRGVLVYVNKAFCRILSLSVKELLDKPLTDFILDNPPAFDGIWDGVCLIKTKNGNALYHFNQKPFEVGNNNFFYGAIQKYAPVTSGDDLTLFYRSPIPALISDVVEHKIQHVNQAFLTLLRLDEKSLNGLTVHDLLTPHSVDMLKSRLVKGLPEKSDRLELIARPEFEERTFNSFIGWSNPKKETYILYLIDATERKNLELQFIHSQKMQAMGQLAGGVAHDFNNLLTAIIGYCDLLLTRHSMGDDSFADLMQIKHNANRAGSLVGKLLTLSRKQPVQIQTVSIHDAFVDLSGLLQRTVSPFVTLKTEIKRNLGCVKMDKNQLMQIFLNLAVNAKDAMPNGGTFSISVGKEKIKKARSCGVDMISAGDYVKIVVSDTGMGIDKKDLPRIFEPFFTTKTANSKSGTGLGLSTVYGIIRGANGFISVDSEKKIGTTFIIWLPRFDEKPTVEKEELRPLNKTAGTQSAQTVLLVDDEDAIRTVAARALKSKGYIVTQCSGAEEALDLFKAGQSFDLLLTDMIMNGMNGEQLIGAVKQICPTQKIILMSGYSEEFARHGSGQSTDFTFLAKPFSLTDLLEKVQLVLSAPVKI